MDRDSPLLDTLTHDDDIFLLFDRQTGEDANGKSVVKIVLEIGKRNKKKKKNGRRNRIKRSRKCDRFYEQPRSGGIVLGI